VEEAVNTKVLGLQINSHLDWNNHIDQIYKLFWAWYMINSLFHISHTNAVKIIDFAYFCFMMKCGVIIFGAYLPNNKEIFTKRKYGSCCWC